MKFNKFILISALSLGLASAKNSTTYFEGVKRSELFQKIELNMPTIRVKFSPEAYARFKLTYQCLHDLHPLKEIDNEDCYKAPWVNYGHILFALNTKGHINLSKLNDKQKEMLTDPYINYENFKEVVAAGSKLRMLDIFSLSSNYVEIPSYEEKNASIEFVLNGEVTEKKSVKFSIGGKYTQVFEKQQYNLKINDGDLFGVKQLRLRSETVDPSFIRSKLGYDLCNVLGLPSIQASYTNLFINDDDMGLYLLRDAYKSHWIETNFGVANTTSLYKCDKKYGKNNSFNCATEDEEVVDDQFNEFVSRVAATKDARELSKFFDTELYLKWQAYKYLTGSWDHVTNQHNQYLFKHPNGKWMNFLYDFDSDFGAYKSPNPNNTFDQEMRYLEADTPFYKILNINDNNKDLVRFIREMVVKAFNPVKLIPRITEIMDFIYPHVLHDRTPEDETVKRPGHFKRPEYKIENGFKMEDFFKNSELYNYVLNKYADNVNYTTDTLYGVKRWIIERFRFVCGHYDIDCSFGKEYLDGGSFKLTKVKKTTVVMEEHHTGCRGSPYPCCKDPYAVVQMKDWTGEWGYEGNYWCLIDRENNGGESDQPADCWSKPLGYRCCTETTVVVTKDKDGEWGIENNNWCGIVKKK